MNAIHRAATPKYFFILIWISRRVGSSVRLETTDTNRIRFVLKRPAGRDTLRPHW